MKNNTVIFCRYNNSLNLEANLYYNNDLYSIWLKNPNFLPNLNIQIDDIVYKYVCQGYNTIFIYPKTNNFTGFPIPRHILNNKGEIQKENKFTTDDFVSTNVFKDYECSIRENEPEEEHIEEIDNEIIIKESDNDLYIQLLLNSLYKKLKGNYIFIETTLIFFIKETKHIFKRILDDNHFEKIEYHSPYETTLLLDKNEFNNWLDSNIDFTSSILVELTPNKEYDNINIPLSFNNQQISFMFYNKEKNKFVFCLKGIEEDLFKYSAVYNFFDFNVLSKYEFNISEFHIIFQGLGLINLVKMGYEYTMIYENGNQKYETKVQHKELEDFIKNPLLRKCGVYFKFRNQVKDFNIDIIYENLLLEIERENDEVFIWLYDKDIRKLK